MALSYRLKGELTVGRLEKSAALYLSDDVMAVWSEPVRALSRRADRPVTPPASA